MITGRKISILLPSLLICYGLHCQSGESEFKYVIINSVEQKVIPPPGSPGSLTSITWLKPGPGYEKTDFPVVEIAALVASPVKLTGIRFYLNGRIPDDKKSILTIPSERENEYRVTRTITLEEGRNELRFEAQNENGSVFSESKILTFEIARIDESYAEKRLALVIGNSSYVHGNYLPNPVNDANAMAQALSDVGFTVMKFLNADQKVMKKAMDDFGVRLNGYTIGLFYYAGHGIQVKGSNYLIPVDAALKVEQDVEYDCIDAGRLLGKMEAAGTRTNIVILDACRNNPFERSWAGRSSSSGNGLAFMNAPSGSLIAYSTSPGKTASDGTGNNSVYTEAILNYIKVPGLTIEEFFKSVRTMVETNSNKEQTPWESTSLKGNFYFRIKQVKE